jgi:hypothetical protein
MEANASARENAVMRKTPFALFAVASVWFGAVAHSQPPSPGAMGHAHGGATLFLAAIDAAHVVPRGNSSATATGAFIADPAKRSVDYEVTFNGLERAPAQRIGLHNFDAAGNGVLIHTICGGDAPKCPDRASANLAGTWDGRGPVALDEKLLGELASGRVYVEVVGSDGKPEIRGQLEPNGAMVPVRNFVAHLAAAPGVDSHGAGTAVLSEVHYGGGRVAVFYRLTVADTSGAPKSAALAARHAAGKLLRRNVLPKLTLLTSRTAPTGATMTGQYETYGKRGDAPFVTRLAAEGADIGIVVATTRFADGELFGVFKPVH